MTSTKRKMKAFSKAAGFTLIELMASMVVLSVGLFSIVQLQYVSIRGVSYAREMDQATQLAQGVIDSLRIQALGWADSQDTAVFTNFSQVFLTNVVQVNLADQANSNVITANLQSLLFYPPNNSIATGQPMAAANLITMTGDSQSSPGMLGQGALYRVNYFAYPMVDQNSQLPSTDITRIILVVSWDNKDYGSSDYGSGQWAQDPNFMRRHMINIPVILSRTRR